MILSKIGVWFWDVVWPPATWEAVETNVVKLQLDDTQAQLLQISKEGVGSSLDAQSPTDTQYYDADIELLNGSEESHSS